jgi:hypothetical protein
VAGGVALALSGCGHRTATAQEQRLERGDLLAVTRALRESEPPVARELAATKAAWPLVIDGLGAHVSAHVSAAIALASERAAAFALPAIFTEREAASLTGPASSIAGTFRTFSLLSTRGWMQIDAAAAQSERGTPAAARFARENVAIYIESVYDAHFGLGQIGKRVLAAYTTLGAAKAFGASLTQAEVDRLAAFYSERNDRLRPRARVRLGS